MLDPFSGAGTSGVATVAFGRSYTGCEPVEEYVDIQRRRLRRHSLLAQEVNAPERPSAPAGPLFDGIE